jgi:iron complex outermembrane receptor protein
VNDNFGWKVTGQYMTANDYKPPSGGPNAEPSDSTHFFGTANVFNEPALVKDYDISSIRTEGSLYYRFSDGWQAEATYGFSENDNFGVTNNGRNRILGWQVQYQSLRVTGDHWFAQATHTSNDAGNTYQINGVASGAESVYTTAIQNGASPELWDSEIQYNNMFDLGLGTLDFVAGGQYRRYLPDSEGTFLADAAGQDIDQTEYGGYLQFDYRPTDAIRINAAARIDEHSEYDTQFSPKAAVVYTVAPSHNIRATYNRAFKTPTILNNYLFIAVPPLGTVARGNDGGYTVRDGPTTNANVVREIDPLQPEEVNTIELGYKGVFNQRLYVNLVGYNSWYTDFISPLTTVANSIPSADNPNPTYAFQNGQLIEPGGSLGGLENGYLLTYFNFGSATVRGLDFGLRYAATEKLELSGNLSLIELSDFEQGDAAEPLLLNVPTTKVKGSVTVRDLGFDNYFVSASGRWKSAYTFRSGYWDSQTFYSDGEIPSRFTASLTAGYTVPNTGVKLKASVTNLFDTQTPDVLGAPRTGRLIWVSATYNFRGLDF